MFNKVLIANRGEIAVRVARTLREMSVQSVALYTEVDRTSLHARSADEAYTLGAEPRAYLDVEAIVTLARRSGCDAVHPGYGFLSENADFAEACAAAGLSFIGPPPAAIRAMGSKERARALMAAAGVPVVPGGGASSLDEARATAERLGYPVLVKASDGGGGKGMRLVQAESELEAALERTRSEAKKAFASDAIYIEKALLRPRHVEVQVLGDQHGNLLHLFERDCSLQRRHQKVLEETPCPVLGEETRQALCEVAIKGASSIGYCSAGTFEFLLAEDGSFYFLEMNTRLQVEHPITELVTGVDLVRQMVRVAAGEVLALGNVEARGAALEARVYAEDPANGFLPSPGTISHLRLPGGPFVRDDSGAYEGMTVSPYYDPLISKLAVWAPTRAEALARLRRALSEYAVGGVKTNLALLDALCHCDEVLTGSYDTGFIEREVARLLEPRSSAAATISAQELGTALAVQAARKNGSAGRDSESSALAPWLLAHRVDLLR
ncbi:MAG TPA: biotin carboxylase N-terminal domain-containing protein [Polyangiaceae bacterium]|nr:biotin carboxylase N-terminal domain-containing protein [Polyangiaceae bacterium]